MRNAEQFRTPLHFFTRDGPAPPALATKPSTTTVQRILQKRPGPSLGNKREYYLSTR
jgi:hypothetical protein